MDLASSGRLEARPRPAFGPRLKSYLSSNNLLNLVHTNEPESKTDTAEEWPDLEPAYDEMTTPKETNFDKMFKALRHRLWTYNDETLGPEYNSSLLVLTDECYKVSKGSKQLQAQVLRLEQENKELRRQNSRYSGSVGSVETPSQDFQAWVETPPNVRHTDNSFPDFSSSEGYSISTIQAITQKSAIESRYGDIEGLFPLPEPSFCQTRISTSSQSSGTRENPDYLGDEQEELKSREVAAMQIATMIVDRFGGQLEDLYSEIARILCVPDKLPVAANPRSLTPVWPSPKKASFNLEHQGQTAMIQSVSPARSPRRENRETVTSVQTQRRHFSFYPGDDGLMKSLEQYSSQYRPPIHVYPPSSERVSSMLKENLQKDESQDNDRLLREDSNGSVITVVNATHKRLSHSKVSNQESRAAESDVPSQEHKALGSRTPSQESRASSSRISSQESKASAVTRPTDPLNTQNKPMVKPQGPLAAAIAATSRFGKKGIRPVSPKP